jgi:catechol 2,3-dioxygenase-like lactoylglutathione lyase family enzyme
MGSNFDFNSTSAKVVAPVKLAHIVLRTNQLDKMGDFYVTFLGGEYAMKAPGLYFITYDDEHHRIGLIGMPDLKKSDRSITGLEHIAFTFASMQELLLAYRQRKALGMEPVWCTNHGPTTSLYYNDPDGNMIETQFDNFDSAEAANEFMRGEAFGENPIGVDFDPEVYIQRLENGESVEELSKRVEIGKRGVEDVPFVKKQMQGV